MLEKVNDGIFKERLPDMEAVINQMYEDRMQKEIKKVRVTSLIYRDTSKFKYQTNDNNEKNTGAIQTYWHNCLQDVTCQYFMKLGIFPFKEEFIYYKDLGLKGHADIILYNKSFQSLGAVEIKNYRKTAVDESTFNKFLDQIMIYSRLLNLNTFYLVIRNFDKMYCARYTMDKVGMAIATDLLNRRYDEHLFSVQSYNKENQLQDTSKVNKGA